MMPIYIVLGVVALIVIAIIAIYNGLVSKRQTVNEAFSGIDVQLKLRRELVPNLVETVKGYAAHEKSTLDAVIAALPEWRGRMEDAAKKAPGKPISSVKLVLAIVLSCSDADVTAVTLPNKDIVAVEFKIGRAHV
mgnify:CR=1 FL=1